MRKIFSLRSVTRSSRLRTFSSLCSSAVCVGAAGDAVIGGRAGGRLRGDETRQGREKQCGEAGKSHHVHPHSPGRAGGIH